MMWSTMEARMAEDKLKHVDVVLGVVRKDENFF